MVFMSGSIQVITKSNDVLEGDLMPYEDIEFLKEQYPVFSFLEKSGAHKEGIFLFTGKKVVYLKRDEIKSMKCLRFT